MSCFDATAGAAGVSVERTDPQSISAFDAAVVVVELPVPQSSLEAVGAELLAGVEVVVPQSSLAFALVSPEPQLPSVLVSLLVPQSPHEVVVVEPELLSSPHEKLLFPPLRPRPPPRLIENNSN